MILLGTDTDAGKSTLARLLLTHTAGAWDYWKPAETGESDSESVRRCCPETTVHPPLRQYREAIAPTFAARREGLAMPFACEMTLPISQRPILIETFGGPFSPLNETELQIALVRQLGLPTVLCVPSRVGAIGQTLTCLRALETEAIRPIAVVMVGPVDADALAAIVQHARIPTFAVTPPNTWDRAGFRASAALQADTLAQILQVPPSSKDNLLARDASAVWHPYTPLVEPTLPIAVVGVEAEFLITASGERLIDGISSWWTIQHEHRHPPLMEAARRALGKWDHVIFGGVTHAPAVECAEALLRTTPWPGGRVFFSDNGSTAVEVALKMAYQYWCRLGQPQRTGFVGFENGYHGDTFGAMSVGRDKLFFGTYEPLLFRAQQVAVDARAVEALLAEHGHEIAAVIIEPMVQGAGGMQMHSADELRAIYDVCRKYEVLFIVDEVMTGGGRTGPYWAHSAAGIVPDLICAAKTLTGGSFPLAATLVSPHVVEVWNTADRKHTFFHGHSFTANPVACAVAAANLELMQQVEYQERPFAIERFWHEQLGDLPNTRIRGTIAAVELNVPGGYLAEHGREMRRLAREQGLFLRPLGNVLYAMPPMRSRPESLRRLAAFLRECALAVGR